MLPFQVNYYGNPHSRTHAYGWESESAMEKARKVPKTFSSLFRIQQDKNAFFANRWPLFETVSLDKSSVPCLQECKLKRNIPAAQHWIGAYLYKSCFYLLPTCLKVLLLHWRSAGFLCTEGQLAFCTLKSFSSLFKLKVFKCFCEASTDEHYEFLLILILIHDSYGLYLMFKNLILQSKCKAILI